MFAVKKGGLPHEILTRLAFVSTGLALATALSSAPASAQSSDAWSLTCQSGNQGGGYASAFWSWTQNGTAVATAAAPPACYGTASQSGLGSAPPANADGYSISLTVCVQPLYFPTDCTSKSVSKSYSAGTAFSATVHASVSAKSNTICFTKCGGNQTITLSEDATFSVSG